MPSWVKASRCEASASRSTGRPAVRADSRSSKRRPTRGQRPRSKSSPDGSSRAAPSSSRRRRRVPGGPAGLLVRPALDPAGTRGAARVHPAAASAAPVLPDPAGLPGASAVLAHPGQGASEVHDLPVHPAGSAVRVASADRRVLPVREAPLPAPVRTLPRAESGPKRRSPRAPSPRSRSVATGDGTARSTTTRAPTARRMRRFATMIPST